MVRSSILDLPPFPEGLKLAPIARISSQKLLDQDEGEGARLLQAARTYGFFYLDLSDSPEGETLLEESEQLLSLCKKAFSIPQEEKSRYTMAEGGSLFGYKRAGTVKLTDRDQRPDMTEFFNVSKDHLHGVEPSRDYPPILQAARPLLADFTQHGHACGKVILQTLARQLGLPLNTFTDLNLFHKPSGDHVRLTKKGPRPTSNQAIGLPSHTDFGSVTVLFNWVGGLQIQSRTEGSLGEWVWVKPLCGHAVINFGDAMVKFTNGDIKSAKHRVVPSPGAQGELDRYSVVYFVRPHNEALMKPVPYYDRGAPIKVAGKFSSADEESKVYSAGEWMLQRGVQMVGGATQQLCGRGGN